MIIDLPSTPEYVWGELLREKYPDGGWSLSGPVNNEDEFTAALNWENASSPPTYAELLPEYESRVADLPKRNIRNIRDNLLESTDWRATIDYPGSNQAAWLQYRQELRDMMEGVDPNNVVWPIAPTED